MKEAPEFEAVYRYARTSVDYFIRKYASKLNSELKEECSQNAMLRTWRAFKKFDQAKSWKSFVQRHCRGAVLDFLKSASAFEDGYGARTDDPNALKSRLSAPGTMESDEHLDFLATAMGEQFQASSSAFAPHWDLVSRMSGKDEDLHIVAKVVLGFTQEAIAAQMGFGGLGCSISRERISQRIYEFFDRLDSCDFVGDPWINQCIYALGLSEKYGEQEIDHQVGWDLKSFDLSDHQSFRYVRRYYRPTLFDFQELSRETYSANELAV